MLDLARLFETEGGSLRRFLRRVAGSVAAEDIAQDTFLRLCALKPENVASDRAYLFATARNIAREQLKRAKTAPAIHGGVDVETLARPSDCPTPEEARIAAEDATALRHALAALSPMQRDALLLRRVERLSAPEVARRLGVSERQMQRLVQQAIAACHAQLAGDGDNTTFTD